MDPTNPISELQYLFDQFAEGMVVESQTRLNEP